MSIQLSKKQSNTQHKKYKHSARAMVATHRGKRLRFLRKITGMVTADFGALCGVGRTTISSWEQGINPLTERGAEKVINGIRTEGIHCTVLWLLHEIGEEPTIIDPDKLSKLNYHSLEPTIETHLEESQTGYGDSKVAKEIDLFKTCYARHLISCIQDHAMHPNYYKGDWVGGIILEEKALSSVHEMDCIAQLKNGLTIARRVKIELLGSLKLSLYVTHAPSSIEHPPLRHLAPSQIIALAPIVRIWRNNTPTKYRE